MKKFDEMNKFEKAYNTLECCGIYGKDDILLWDNMSRDEIISFLQEYSDNALQECPLDHISERADIILDLLDERKTEIEHDELDKLLNDEQ